MQLQYGSGEVSPGARLICSICGCEEDFNPLLLPCRFLLLLCCVCGVGCVWAGGRGTEISCVYF
jgi:hypothetical protein